MSNGNQRWVARTESAGFFLLRTPALPQQVLQDWSAGLCAVAAAGTPELGEALAQDRSVLRERLFGLVERPDISEAVYLASPSMYAAFRAGRGKPGSASDTEHALARYLQRMAARCTPFGLFAGVTHGQVGSRSELRLQTATENRRQTRVRSEILLALGAQASALPEVRQRLAFVSNISRYRVGEELRYLESEEKVYGRSFTLSSVGWTPVLEQVLARATRGATRAELIAEVQRSSSGLAAPEAAEEVAGFVDALIDAQVLEHDLAPPVTWGSKTLPFVERLRRVGAPAASAVERIETVLSQLDASQRAVEPHRYLELQGTLEALLPHEPLAQPFELDLYKPGQTVELSEKVVKVAVAATEVLLAARDSRDRFGPFRAAFEERYGAREVPLAEALDPELGVGTPGLGSEEDFAPALVGLPFEAPAEGPLESWSRFDVYLRERVLAARAQGSPELELTAEEVKAHGRAEPMPLPTAFSIFGTLLTRSPEALASGDFRFHLRATDAPGGLALLGRFARVSPELEESIGAYAAFEQEQEQEALYAEVVHLPGIRAGGVVMRPRLRPYEIPVATLSDAPLDHQFPVSDLRIRVVNGRIRLRSARLDREVIPRFSNAHDFHQPTNVGVYRFLCALPMQHGGIGTWSWGPLATWSALPRVVCGKAVLAPAQWFLGPAQVKALREADPARAFTAWQRLREELGWPRQLMFARDDVRLPVDLDNVLSTEAAAQVMRPQGALLTEHFAGPAGAAVEGPEGSYANEVILPIRTRALEPARAASPLLRELPRVEGVRAYPPGSNWLYLKLYGGTAQAEGLLLALAPALQSLLREGVTDRWYFLRYLDPQPHLRLRLHGADAARLWSEGMARLNAVLAELAEEQRPHRVQVDTYQPELERYGGEDGMELAELLFFADSHAALELLATEPSPELGLFTLLMSSKRWAEDFGLGAVEQRDFFARLDRAYAEETRAAVGLEPALRERLRRERAAVESALGETPPPELLELAATLERRSQRGRPLLAQLDARGVAGVSRHAFLASVVHLSFVRHVRSRFREHERLVYALLARYSEARLRRRES